MGRGVELTRTIAAGTLLGIYPGTYLSMSNFLEKQEFVKRAVRSTYRFSDEIIIDPTDMFGFVPNTPEKRIALINEPPAGAAVNVAPISTRRYVWFLTISDVHDGEQLFTHYGNQYRRDYSSQIKETEKLGLSPAQISSLAQVMRRYRWLKEGIACQLLS